MQHTNQYQFNLIESGDTFSPDPLNENMEKVEEVLAKQAETLNDHTMAIAAGVKYATGTYTGTGTYGSSSPNTITFTFQPKFVIVAGDTHYSLFFYGFSSGFGHNQAATGASNLIQSAAWNGNTLSWYNYTVNGAGGNFGTSAPAQLNSSGVKYYYFAIGQ